MGFWSSFLGTDNKSVEKTLEIAEKSLSGIGGWIDGKDFTSQESAQLTLKAIESHTRMMEAIRDESSGRAVTRRYMAWGIVGTILVWANVGFAIIFFGPRTEETINRMKDAVDWANALYIGFAFVTIITFFFGVQMVRNWGGKSK